MINVRGRGTDQAELLRRTGRAGGGAGAVAPDKPTQVAQYLPPEDTAAPKVRLAQTTAAYEELHQARCTPV